MKWFCVSLMVQLLLQQTPMLGVEGCYSGLNSQSLWELPFKEKVSLMEEALSGGKISHMMIP